MSTFQHKIAVLAFVSLFACVAGAFSQPSGTTGLPAHSQDAKEPARFPTSQELVDSPDYVLHYERITGLEVQLAIRSENKSHRSRYSNGVRKAVEFLDALYGDLAVDTLTVIDAVLPDSSAPESTVPGRVFVPIDHWLLLDNTRLLEKQIFRAIAAQYWSASVVPEQNRTSWLLHGIADYNAMRMMEIYFGRHGNLIDHLGLILSDDQVNRLIYLKQVTAEQEWRSVDVFIRFREVGAVARAKAALVWEMVSHLIGSQQFERSLQIYYLQHRGKTAQLSDLLAVCEGIGATDLTPLIQQFDKGNPSADYAITSLQRKALQQTDLPDGSIDLRSDSSAIAYLCTVSIMRDGDLAFPVEIEIKMENGETGRLDWDGQSRSKKMQILTSQPVVSVIIDPEQKFLFDVNLANNSKSAAAQFGDEKLLGRWLFMLQNLVILLTSFIG